MALIEDHARCPADAHTFDAGDVSYEGPVDGHGRTLCNDCQRIMFYCTADENYHHAGASTPACFLVPEPGQNVPVPASAELPDGWAPRECWRCHVTLAYRDVTTQCQACGEQAEPYPVT